MTDLRALGDHRATLKFPCRSPQSIRYRASSEARVSHICESLTNHRLTAELQISLRLQYGAADLTCLTRAPRRGGVTTRCYSHAGPAYRRLRGMMHQVQGRRTC